MNRGNSSFSIDLSNLTSLLWPVLFLGLLASVGLGWLVNSILILIGLILIAPIVAFLILRWWVNRNLITGPCPVCATEVTGFNDTQFFCPNCQSPLQIDNGSVHRVTPPGTIDVEAVDVSVSQISSGD